VLDVVERVRRVAILVGEQERGHVADHDRALVALCPRCGEQRLGQRGERDALRDHDVRLLDAELAVARRRPLGGDDVGGEVRVAQLRRLGLREGRVVDVRD